MQDIVFYAAANETLGVVRDYANARKAPAPVLTLGVSVCLRMRLFAALDTAGPYPVSAFSGITDWQWRMDGDFDRTTTCKLVADANGISVHCVTDTVSGETMDFTEFVIPISNMNTQELAAWLGNEPKRTGLTGELVGYDSEEHAVFVLQIDNFTVRNRVAGLGDPTAVDQEIVTRTTAEQMIRTAVSASAETKQDKLTSSNAGSGISIEGNGVISTKNVPQSAISGLSASLAAKQDNLAAGFRMELVGGSTVGQKRYFQIETPTGSSITLQAGHAYRISATTGQKTLNVEAMNANEIGLEGHAEIFVANTGFVRTGENVILANPLEPDAVNNCVIRFHDGRAIIDVEDHVAGYIVTVNAASGAGSLAYGLATATNEYISVDASLNGQTLNLAGVTTYAGEKHIVGNGYENTILSGGIICNSKTTVSNLSLLNVAVNGGTMIFGDAFIPSGSTVAVNGGGLAVEKITGNGGVVDLGYNAATQTGGTNIEAINTSVYISGVELTNGHGRSVPSQGVNQERGGAVHVNGASGYAYVYGSTISGNNGGGMGGGIALSNSARATLVNVTVTNNTATIANCIYIGTGQLTASNCVLGGGSYLQNAGASIIFTGSNAYSSGVITGNGSAVLTSGATLDLTGNPNTTPIAPGGGITFEEGGATVLTGDTAGVVDAQYMLGGMTVPKLTNTNTVDLGGTRMVVSSGSTANASGCVFTGGNAGDAQNGGVFSVAGGAQVNISGCTASGNIATRGGVFSAINGGIVSAVSCTFSGNTGSTFAGVLYGNANATFSSCTFTGNTCISNPGNAINNGGTTTLVDCVFDGRISGDGSVVISGTLDLTGNTNATPVRPGGGIVIYGGPMTSGTKIIGSAGSAAQTREFEDVEIHGTSISNPGIICGATVTIPDERIYHIRYTMDGGSTSSSVTITGPTVYVLTDELGAQAELTGVVNI